MGLSGSVGPFQPSVSSLKDSGAASSPFLRGVLGVVLMIVFDQGVGYLRT